MLLALIKSTHSFLLDYLRQTPIVHSGRIGLCRSGAAVMVAVEKGKVYSSLSAECDETKLQKRMKPVNTTLQSQLFWPMKDCN